MRQASKGQQGWGIFRPGIHGSTPPGVDAQTRAEICALWAACRPRQDRPACEGSRAARPPAPGWDTGCLMPLTGAGLACLTRSCEGLLVGLYRGKDQGY